MNKKLAGLLGAAAAVTTIAGAQAAPTPTTELPKATNDRELLESPIRYRY